MLRDDGLMGLVPSMCCVSGVSTPFLFHGYVLYEKTLLPNEWCQSRMPPCPAVRFKSFRLSAQGCNLYGAVQILSSS